MTGLGRRRAALGTGLSLGAALGMGASAEATDFTVDRTDDPGAVGACVLATPNDCSLRQAIGQAENGNGPTVDRVLFESGISGTITLASAGLSVSEPLEIVGPGASALAVSGGGGQRVLFIDTVAAAPVTISGLTLTAGYGSGSVGGGGIYSKDAELTVDNSTVSNSVAGVSGADYVGGGIRQVNGQLLVRNSTVSGNEGGNGGGVHAQNADVGIQNSTISGNTATGSGGGSGYGYGGGLWLDEGASGSLIAYGATISDNHAVYGGGVSAAVATNGVANSVISDNTATSALDLRTAGADPFKLAFSLVEHSAGASIVDIPTFAGSNMLDVDPQLGPLAANGGPTRTMKPSLTSPLIDKGIITAAPRDQRGLPRPFDVASIPNSTVTMADGADIGAVELQAADYAPPAQPAAPAAKPKCKKKKKKAKRGSALAGNKKKKCKRKRKK